MPQTLMAALRWAIDDFFKKEKIKSTVFSVPLGRNVLGIRQTQSAHILESFLLKKRVRFKTNILF
jgi:hypothetical protein